MNFKKQLPVPMKSFLFFLCLYCITLKVNAQYFNDVLSYHFNGTPENGVKIKTNLPFSTSSQMPTLSIEGYAYGTEDPINLTLNYYIFNNAFTRVKVSTSGAHNPRIFLAAENGKVVIFLDSKVYFQRFHVRAFAMGRIEETAANFSGWTAVDSSLLSTAVATYEVPYQNKFVGETIFSTNSRIESMRFDANGNIGIGTTTPGPYRLAVEGTIGTRRIQVKQTSWADFVFSPEYQLPTLQEVEQYIVSNEHLPDIPSAAEVQKDGFDVGEMNKKLLQKIEELTLYIIRQQKEIDHLSAGLKELQQKQ
jgi:hypothetical protein